MKSMGRFLASVVALNLISVASFAKEEAQIRLRINTKSTYEQVSETELKGLVNSLELFIEIEGTNADGTKVKESLGPISGSEVNTETLTLDENAIISQSAVSGRKFFKAKISDSSIVVSKSEILRVSAETLMEKGQSLMTQFNIQTNEGQAGVELDVADMNCERAQVVTCKSAVVFTINASR